MPDPFGRLAGSYEGLERLVYGDRLQGARLALLDELAQAGRILVLGEGDGRFLLELLRRHDTCEVTVLERSPGMVKRAQTRLAHCPPATRNRVTFRQGDALSAPLPENGYDALVTHFFLDVFRAQQLPGLTEKLSACLRPGGLWLLGDFAPPQAVRPGRYRLLSRALLPLMYAFFRMVAGLPARHLTPPQPYLERCGLEAKQRRTFLGGFLYAELWQKPESGSNPKRPRAEGRRTR